MSHRHVMIDEETQTVQPPKKAQGEREKKTRNATRFDRLEHWIEFDDPSGDRKGYRCKHCGAQSNTFCTKCMVHLCFVRERKKSEEGRKIRNCFKAFHIIEVS